MSGGKKEMMAIHTFLSVILTLWDFVVFMCKTHLNTKRPTKYLPFAQNHQR